MLVRTVRLPIACLALLLCLVAIGLAADPASEKRVTSAAPVKEFENPSSALSLLQSAQAKDGNTFVVQSELDCLIDETGGGACASAAGIDVLQCIRVMAGLDKLPHPHKVVLSSFADQKELLKGRVSNEQFVRLIKFYEKQLESAKLSVEVKSAPNSPHATDKAFWSRTDGPDLSVAPRQIKVLSYTVTEANGNVLGRHFVLLKGQAKNQITVVDPAHPISDRRYVLEFAPAESGDYQRVFLLNPVGTPTRTLVYEFNTVFKVSIDQAGIPAQNASDDTISIEDIKNKIDQTAQELRGTDDYLSPRAWRKKTSRFGLPGLDLPVAYGGGGWPASKMVEVFKHAGRHNLNFRDVVGGAHVRPLLHSDNPGVRQIVRQVANGEGYVAIAITEPTAGSDVPAIKSSSRRVQGGYLLTGTKRFNARLDQATHVIIFTQGTSGKQAELSVFVVPIDTPGLTIERLQAHGLTGNSFGGLSFKDLFVPEGLLVGEDGKGQKIFFKHFLYWRLMQAAAALGTGEQALEQMADRIKTRHAFGGPIGRFTHLQQALGQYWTELRMAQALAREAAALIDDDQYSKARPLVCGLKAEGVEIALRAVDAATRAFGGEGYSTIVDLGDRLRDLNGLRIADGTTDVMRMDVVRKAFGDEFWYMAVQPKE